MINLKKCIKAAIDLNENDTNTVLSNYKENRAKNMSAEEAEKVAVQDAIASAEKDLSFYTDLAHEQYPETDDGVIRDAADAERILDAAGVKGKDRLDTLGKFRTGEYSIEDIRAAYPEQAVNNIGKFTQFHNAIDKDNGAWGEITGETEKDYRLKLDNGRFANTGKHLVKSIEENKPAEAKQTLKEKAEVKKTKNTVFTDDAAAAALALIKSKLGQVNAGIDPELFKAGLTLAGHTVESGTRTFAAYSEAMIEMIGDAVKPYLKQWYNAVRDEPDFDAEGMTPYADMDAIIKQDSTKSDKIKPKTEEKEDGSIIDDTVPGDGEGTLDLFPPGDVEGTEGGKRASSRGGQGGKKDAGRGKAADEQGRKTGRGRGNIPADVDNAAAGAIKEATENQNLPKTNFTITDEVNLGSGGATTKFKDNIEAIKTLKDIEAGGRPATAAEQKKLARYVGWGGLANSFKNRVTGAIAKGWEGRVEELAGLLTEKELSDAAQSTRNAHYTSKPVVDAMWTAASRIGFGGGNVLEPAMGTGNFIGLMPKGNQSFVTGIELDSLTARIAGKLYPESSVFNMSFGEVPLPENKYDLIIGNPPFGKNQMEMNYMPQFNKKSIHNQFFLGSLEALRPNGVMAMVVSRYLLDAKDSATRNSLASQADFIGAIRMPGIAFKQSAGTEVVTDIIFLRKKMGENQRVTPADKAQWVETGTLADPLGGEDMTINNYFIKNPEMVVGTLDGSGSMQHGANVDVKFEGNFEAALNERINKLPEVSPVQNKYWLEGARNFNESFAEAVSLSEAKAEVGEVIEKDGVIKKVIYSEDADGSSMMKSITLNAETPWSNDFKLSSDGRWYENVPKLDKDGNKVKRGRRNVYVPKFYETIEDVPSRRRLGKAGLVKLKGLLKLRDLIKAQVSLEANNDAGMEANRKKLNKAYDSFVKQHGFITEPKNAKIVSDMPDEALLISMEKNYRPQITAARAKRSGIKARPASAEKADIFSAPVAIPPEIITSTDSLEDAVAITMADTGRLDVTRISELLGVDDASNDLLSSGLAFADPEQNQMLVDKNEYLSGNVKQKLKAAKESAMMDNVAALEKVQPEQWSADKITPVMGGAWIPGEVYSEFLTKLLGTKGTVRYFRLTNTFDVGGQRTGAAATTTWGTPDYPAPALVSAILNDSKIVVTAKDSEGKTFVLEANTQAAKDKADEIKDAFDEWIFKDQARRKSLTELFNDKFNVLVNRQHDGSHMKYPGKVPDDIIKMRRGQNNAVWRGIVERTVLYDHAVGAGKTFVGVARAMERKRMGLSNKPLVVVPNHIVPAWGRDIYTLYPGAKALIPSKNDLEKKNRRRFFARMATGNWDIIVIPHSFMQFLSLSNETQLGYLNEEIKLATDGLAEAERVAAEESTGGWGKPPSVKQAENLLDKLEQRLDKLLNASASDRLLTFEQIGIDDLTIDESHEFKNLQYVSSLQGVKGMGTPTGSQKAMDLYFKTKYLKSQNGSIAFMTGTPISNSAVEMYTIMRYLSPELLESMGLEHFDSFRPQFVSVSSAYEPTDSGSGLKRSDRLGREWANMRALMDSYYSFADVVTNDDIKEWYKEDNNGKEYPLPKVKGGFRKPMSVEPTPAQSQAIETIVAGFDGLQGISDPKERNAERLRLMDRARKISIHAKALDPLATDEKGGKLDVVADNVKRVYDKWNADKGTQLVFLDRSIPKSRGDNAQVKKFDDTKARMEKALSENNEAAYRKAADALEKFNENEIEAMRIANAGGWNAYQHIKDNLVSQGIPENEIAFIHSYSTPAQKQDLFNDVNDGNIRVLIGSTPRMGAGTNVQQRLVALHHVDATWKPSDIEQREGRIIRQGNLLHDRSSPDQGPIQEEYKNFEVEILAYVTQRTVDAKLWSLNSTKLAMINAIRHYEGQFEMSFDDNDSVSMSEIAAIASGDPLLLRRFELEGDLAGLARKQKGWRRRVQAAEDSFADAQGVISNEAKNTERAIARDKDVAALDGRIKDDNRSITINGEVIEDKFAAKFLIEKEGADNKRVDINGEPTTKTNALKLLEEIFGDNEYFNATFKGETFNKRGQYVAAIASQEEVHVGTYFGAPAELSRQGNWVEYSVVIDDGTKNGTAITGTGRVKDGDPNNYPSAVREAMTSAKKSIEVSANWPSINNVEEKLANAKRDEKLFEKASKEEFKEADELEKKQEELASVESTLQRQAGDIEPGTVGEAPAPAASRKTIPPTGTTTKQLDKWLKNPVSKLAEWVPIQTVQSVNDVPGNHPQDVRGVFAEGKVYLVADNITKKDAQTVLAHEVVGHLGLERLLGEQGFSQLVRQVKSMKRTGNKQVADVIKILKKNYVDENGKYTLDDKQEAREILAHIAENKPKSLLLARIKAAIKRWLAKNGFTDVDEANIQTLIVRATQLTQTSYSGFTEKGGKLVPAYMVAYHGTPHAFEKFSMDKVGTGEGAQAYGHGLYFASNREVAEYYQDAFSDLNIPDPKTETEEFARTIYEDAFQVWGGEDAVLMYEDRLDDAFGEYSEDYPGISKKEVLAAFKRMSKDFKKGNLYEVDLAPEQEDYLDWDKPLAEQSKKVTAALRKIKKPGKMAADMTRQELIDVLQFMDSNGVWTDADNIREFGRPATLEQLRQSAENMEVDDYMSESMFDVQGATARSIYMQLATKYGGGEVYSNEAQKKASEHLLSLGIRGIKYLDNTSRATTVVDSRLMGFYDKYGDVDTAIDEFMKTVHETQIEKAKMRRQFVQQLNDIHHNYVIFSEDDIAIRAAYSRQQQGTAGNPDLDSAREKVGKTANWKDKLKEIKDSPKAMAKQWWKSINQGVFDRFSGIEDALDEAGVDVPMGQNGYIAARLSTSVADRLAVLLKHGQMEWKDGALQPIEGTKGFLDVLEPVADSLEDFGLYLVGKRAKEINASDRQSGFTEDEVDAMIALGTQQNKFAEVAAEYQEINKSVLDIAEDAGLINAENRAMWESDNYIPFYRILEEGSVAPKGSGKGITGKSSGIRRLKGSDKNIGDPLENIMMNWAHLLDASVKNHASVMVVDNLAGSGILSKAKNTFKKRRVGAEEARKRTEELLANAGIDPGVGDLLSSAPTLQGLTQLWSIEPPVGKDVIRIMRGGKAEYHHVHDPLLFRSMTAINQQQWGRMMEIFRMPKRMLTSMVTADPAFMARNYLRDMLSAWVLGRDKFVPGIDSVKGAAKAFREDPDFVKMMAAGGTFSSGGYINANDPNEMRRFIQSEVKRQHFSGTILNSPKRLWDFWQHLGASVENANRVAVSESALKSGKGIAGAAYEMKDIMDFAMRGDYAVIQFLAETVPFFSARIQGLHRLGRGAYENPKAFAVKGSAIMVASIALYMLNRDDERFKELEEWDRDIYYHFWIGDKHYRLPKPFEVGVLFGTMPERMVEAMIQEDKNAEDFFKRMGWNLRETLALEPIPQTIKPIIEQWANKSFFTQRPIVGQRLKNQDAETQYEPWTSETMRILGRAWGVSPKRAEALARGYFGTIGMYALSATDTVIRSLNDYPPDPTMSAEHYPVLKSFYRGSGPARNTRYVTEFYEMATEINSLQNSINEYRRQGKHERASKLYDKNAKTLRYRKPINKLRGEISKINKASRAVHYSENMSPDQKREALDRLIKRKNELTKRGVELYAD